VNLNKLITACGPDYWLYGHHHQNIPEFSIGHTKLITNQAGYVRADEQALFDRAKVVEL
jgi:hypothetical protein